MKSEHDYEERAQELLDASSPYGRYEAIRKIEKDEAAILYCLHHSNPRVQCMMLDALGRWSHLSSEAVERVLREKLRDPKYCANATRALLERRDIFTLQEAVYDADKGMVRGPVASAVLAGSFVLGERDPTKLSKEVYYGQVYFAAQKYGEKSAELVLGALRHAIATEDAPATRFTAGLMGSVGCVSQLEEIRSLPPHPEIDQACRLIEKRANRKYLVPNESIRIKRVEPYNVDGIEIEGEAKPHLSVFIDRSTQHLSIEVEDTEAVKPVLIPQPFLGARMTDAGLLALKAKQFDDGLLCSLQMEFGGMVGLLGAWLEALRERSSSPQARARLVAALQLVGESPNDDPEILGIASNMEDRIKDKCRPLGFYAWHPRLHELLFQTKLLQEPLTEAEVDAFAQALSGDADLEGRYRRSLELNFGLANPAAGVGPIGSSEAEAFALFPASRTHEDEFIKTYFSDRRPETSLIDEFVSAVKSGVVSLETRPDSGWYDHQVFALEPLIRPDVGEEMERVSFGGLYRNSLEDLFRALFALTRETHFSSFDVMETMYCPGIPKIEISPTVRFEPLLTYYQRRVESYDFIMELLKQHIGVARLKKMHRWTSDGPVDKPLDEELVELRALFRGAAVACSQDLGFLIKEQPNDKQDLKWALRWKEDIRQDPDLSKDPRMMVPIGWDSERRVWRVWALIGFEELAANVSFSSRPKVEVWYGSELLPRDRYELEWEDTRGYLCRPVCVELETTELLTREEFQKICDGLPSNTYEAKRSLRHQL